MFSASDVFEPFAEIEDAGLGGCVDAVGDAVDEDLEAFVAQEGGEHGQMVLVACDIARRHHADEMHRAAQGPDALDELLQCGV